MEYSLGAVVMVAAITIVAAAAQEQPRTPVQSSPSQPQMTHDEPPRLQQPQSAIPPVQLPQELKPELSLVIIDQRLRQLEMGIAALQASSAASVAKVAQLQSANVQLQAELNALETTETQHKSDIFQLKVYVTELQARVANLTDAIYGR